MLLDREHREQHVVLRTEPKAAADLLNAGVAVVSVHHGSPRSARIETLRNAKETSAEHGLLLVILTLVYSYL